MKKLGVPKAVAKAGLETAVFARCKSRRERISHLNLQNKSTLIAKFESLSRFKFVLKIFLFPLAKGFSVANLARAYKNATAPLFLAPDRVVHPTRLKVFCLQHPQIFLQLYAKELAW